MLNKGALQFIKVKKDFNKDEVLALGYIFGMKDAFKSVMSKNMPSLKEETIDEYVNDFVTYEMQEKVWKTLEEELELELRDFSLTHIAKK